MPQQPTTALTAEQRRDRRERRQAATRRRRRLALAGLLTLGLVAAASGAVVGARPATGGTRAVTPARARAAAAPGPIRPVVFTVEASGDLLIHSPVWERALELGGGTHYNFAALFTQIKPYITGTDLPLCAADCCPAPRRGGA